MEKRTLFVGLFIGVAVTISCGLAPTPTPTSTPTPTPTRTATSTPRPTSTPTSTSTPAPTSTPRATSTPRPTRTPTLEPIATEAPVTVTDEELIAVIYQNLDAAQNEDIDAYMATIHPDSPAYAATEQAMQPLFEQYDVSYKLESVEVISKTDTEAQVRVVQVTKKVSGPAFQDNRITAVHTLWVSDGTWKIYGTTLENVEYLN